MSEEPALGPMGDVHLLVAALRSDREDVASYTRVFSDVLGDALPSGVVEVDRQRTLADRMSGREGRPVAVRVRTAERLLALRQGRHGVEAEIQQVVRGVVISRRQVGMEEWLTALAEELRTLAAQDAAARTALERLLGT
jgi:hypothetical protein